MKFNKKSQYSLALVLSLIVHVVTFSSFYYNSRTQEQTALISLNKTKSAAQIRLDTVKFISKKQLDEIKAMNRQIVANELTGKKERPVNSRFAGEQNQSFDRQTIARNIGAFKKAGLGSMDGAESARQVEQAQRVAVPHKKTASAQPKLNSTPKALSLSDLGTVKINKAGQMEKIQDELAPAEGQNLDEQIKRAAAAQGLAKGSREETGFSRNNDFIEDVPLGDVTNLNTTEFKYYGFYHRIRQKLEQYWGSSIQSKAKHLYKSGRRIPASENLITAISVTLDDHGQILEIKIEGTSGIRELDQAAIESFNKAGPFPNPPKGLLVDGRAVIQWGFVVKS